MSLGKKFSFDLISDILENIKCVAYNEFYDLLESMRKELEVLIVIYLIYKENMILKRLKKLNKRYCELLAY